MASARSPLTPLGRVSPLSPETKTAKEVQFHPLNATILTAMNDDGWSGRHSLTRKQQDDLLDSIKTRPGDSILVDDIKKWILKRRTVRLTINLAQPGWDADKKRGCCGGDELQQLLGLTCFEFRYELGPESWGKPKELGCCEQPPVHGLLVTSVLPDSPASGACVVGTSAGYDGGVDASSKPHPLRPGFFVISRAGKQGAAVTSPGGRPPSPRVGEMEPVTSARALAQRVRDLRHTGSVDLLCEVFVNKMKVSDEYPSTLHGLLNLDLVQAASADFDKDRSGTLDKHEWHDFLDQLAVHHLQFCLTSSFTKGQIFYGRGQDNWAALVSNEEAPVLDAEDLRRIVTEDSDGRVEDDDDRKWLVDKEWEKEHNQPWCCGACPNIHFHRDPDCGTGRCWFPKGWWSDFFYFSANVHPLHGIFSADPNNRFDRFERFFVELATLGIMYMMALKQEEWVVNDRPPYFAQWLSDPVAFALCNTILGVLSWWMLFMLFTCPCSLADPARHPPRQVRRLDRVSAAAGAFGWLLVVGGGCFFVWEMYRMSTQSGCLSAQAGCEGATDYYACLHESPSCEASIKRQRTQLWQVFLARIRGYGISWFLAFALWMNPVVHWGSAINPSHPGNLVGIGQWTVEKQKFKLLCHRVLHHSPRPSYNPNEDDYGMEGGGVAMAGFAGQQFLHALSYGAISGV